MTLANWRDLAVILLVIQAFVIVLIPGVVLFFAIRGMSWVRRKLRAGAPVVQDTFRRAASISERISHRVASPVIATSAALAQVQSLRSAPATLLRRTLNHEADQIRRIG